jgi:hypothetical protein
MALSAAGLVLYAQLPVHGQYFSNLFPAFILSGIGLAFAFVPMSIGALTGVKPATPASLRAPEHEPADRRRDRRRPGHHDRDHVHEPLRRWTPRRRPARRRRPQPRLPDRLLRPRRLAAIAAVISAIMIEPGAAAATVPNESVGDLTPALEEAA